MSDIVFKEESYKIIGACMEVHKKPGSGFLESVYAEALELEFNKVNIPYERVRFKQLVLKAGAQSDPLVYGGLSSTNGNMFQT